MRLSTATATISGASTIITPGPRTIAQAVVPGSSTITPNTAFADLIRINPIVGHGVPVRVTATIAVNLTGTTNTVRTVFFRLVHGAGAGTTLQGNLVSLNNDVAATAFSESVAMSFIVLAPPANPTDQYALQWSTGANATANVNGTDPNTGGAVLNVEELVATDTAVTTVTGTVASAAPLGDTLIFDTRQANNPVDVLRAVQRSFADALLVNPDMQLVDFFVSGGGAGNVFLVELVYHIPQLVEDVVYPDVSTLAAAVAFGPDNTTNTVSLNRILAANPTGSFEVLANACAGDGAIWLTLLAYVPGAPGPGPTAPVRTLARVLAAKGTPAPTTPIATVQKATAKVPTTVLSFTPSPFNTPPPAGPPPKLPKQ